MRNSSLTVSIILGKVEELKSRLENIRKDYEKENDRFHRNKNVLQNQLNQQSYLDSRKYKEELQAFQKHSDSQRGEVKDI